MVFEKNNWKSGDVISSTKLNKMEDGIVEASEPVSWEDVTNKPETFTPSTHSHTWEDITDRPETFPPTIGTTATTAKAGNYVPTYAEITGKPTTFTPTIGTTATTAKAGNYVPTWSEITGKPSTFAPATHTHTVSNVTGLQALLDDFEARLSALEATAEEPTDPVEGA